MPPFIGVAVKVVLAPEQVGLVPAVWTIFTIGVSVVPTVIVMLLLVSFAGLGQVALDVSTHVITCPFVNAEVV